MSGIRTATATLRLLAAVIVTVLPVRAQAQRSDLEYGINRPGGDYRDFSMPRPVPTACQAACRDDPRCRAFTYVNPGVQGRDAHCWLKEVVPKPVQDKNCVSGLKPYPSSPRLSQPDAALQYGTNYPGGDYDNFDLPRNDPADCQSACGRDPRCRSFTYVKPGIQGPHARCWLKNVVPKAVLDVNCISGVRTQPKQLQLLSDRNLRFGINYPGGDYRDFDLKRPVPADCQNACFQESQCRAFTYVKPGVQGPNARCWLKRIVPSPVDDTNCVSGVK